MQITLTAALTMFYAGDVSTITTKGGFERRDDVFHPDPNNYCYSGGCQQVPLAKDLHPWLTTKPTCTQCPQLCGEYINN